MHNFHLRPRLSLGPAASSAAWTLQSLQTEPIIPNVKFI